MNVVGYIMMYFVCWGLWYGVTLGLITGAAFYPPVSGIVFGSVMVAPCIAFFDGLIMVVYHRLFFHSDVDLALYRRGVARAAGLITGIGMALFIAVDAAKLNGPAGMVVFLALSLPFIFWAGLASAYTARQCAVWLITQINTDINPSDLPSKGPRIAAERNRLLRQMHRRWWSWLIGVPAGLAFLYHITTYFPQGFYRNDPNLFQFHVVLFAMVALPFTIYCAVGNAALITFVKVLILEDYFPNLSVHRHRVILTCLSFLYTLITTWWTLIFAPLYALFMAYHVYHTLALPIDDYDKAKRKEKTSAVIEAAGVL